MAVLFTNAPTGVTLKHVLKSGLNAARWLTRRDRLPQISDRMARDIGLTPAQVEWQRLRLPSEGPGHPML